MKIHKLRDLLINLDLETAENILNETPVFLNEVAEKMAKIYLHTLRNSDTKVSYEEAMQFMVISGYIIARAEDKFTRDENIIKLESIFQNLHTKIDH